jgi:hypothetical protein
MNTNGNSYQDRGAQARPQMKATRTKVTFDPPRVPVFLRPEAVPTNPVDGRNGPQFMWLFQDDQIAWFDPDFHAELIACLQMNPEGVELAITKHVRRGTPPRFEVQPVAEVQEPGGYDPPPPPLRREPPPVTAARRIEEIKSSQAKPKYHFEEAIEAETHEPKESLTKALIAAITACHEAAAIANAVGIKFVPTPAQIIDLAKVLFKAED